MATSTARASRLTAEAVDADRRAAEIVDRMTALDHADPRRAVWRQQAIEAWLPMARRLARRYANRGETSDDLQQTASVGLIKAIDGFDPARGSDFVSYAIPTVLGELKRHFRDRAWTMRIPRRLQELRLAISAARHVLEHCLQRPATVADLAAHLEVGEEAILEALESGHAYRPSSLHMPVDAEQNLELGDTLGVQDPGFAMTDFAVSLPPAMNCLPERERRIVILRFFGGQTQKQIAEQVGISQMQISRLLTAALAKLRAELDGPPRPR
ncbi:SigB/SigF/SigG family RNA polymerase sigma factor [Actinoplanes awajinensis]|nr:SigB/SigF/SigG family RNA polymerase sigma factor [Actinoplanes awajinensis]